MGLSTALTTALTGLQASTYGLSVVSSNVANADTPGYARRRAVTEPGVSDNGATSVRVTEVARQVDIFVQRQLRVENGSAGYATELASYYQRLDALYGTPGGPTALDTMINDVRNALQGLATTPESPTTRAGAINAARTLATQLNGLSADVQAMRSDTEEAIGAAVKRVNTLLETIAGADKQIVTETARGSVDISSLLDQRDAAIDELSRLIDVRATVDGNGGINIATNSGLVLYNGRPPAKLGFDPQTPVTANDRYSADPAARGVGTIFLEAGDGSRVDLLAMGAIRSGQIAALVDMRDNVLPGAQAQLDDIAAQLADSLSRRDVAGTAVSSGGRDGFDIDLTGMQPGNIARLTYTDATGPKTVSFVRVDDPSVLPLANSHTAEAGDRVVGIDFSGGPASVAAQIQAALGGSFQVANPGGDTIRILDDGAANQVTIAGLTAGITETQLQGGSGALPLFIDAGRVPSTYSRVVDAAGDQKVGFAARIAINPAVTADPSLLVAYQGSPAVPSGDTTRPAFLLDRFVNDQASFVSNAGDGVGRPFTGTIAGFTRQVLDTQANAAARASSLKTGQDVVVDLLQKKSSEVSGVNIDREMADLLTLQQAYSANARVITAVKEMIDLLLRV